MTTRKRKSPDRKKPVRQPGLALRLIGGAGRAAARHPKPLFAAASLCVVFSFVAANALWYQPGGHPSPFLATREAGDPNRIAGYRPMRRTPPDDVTTFRIERAPPSAPRPQVPAAPIPATIPAPIPAEVPQQAYRTASAPPSAPPPSPAGPKVTRIETSKPASVAPAKSPQPLPAMPPKAIPVSRPSGPDRPGDEDPVAAAIRASERKPSTPDPDRLPPADIPNVTGSNPGRSAIPAAVPAAVPAPRRPASDTPVPEARAASLVLQIQRGLSNIAYADVEVDGVAGAQTKAAIRRFQKHYRLPETGEPDEMVLKKLKSIGAL